MLSESMDLKTHIFNKKVAENAIESSDSLNVKEQNRISFSIDQITEEQQVSDQRNKNFKGNYMQKQNQQYYIINHPDKPNQIQKEQPNQKLQQVYDQYAEESLKSISQTGYTTLQQKEDSPLQVSRQEFTKIETEPENAYINFKDFSESYNQNIIQQNLTKMETLKKANQSNTQELYERKHEVSTDKLQREKSNDLGQNNTIKSKENPVKVTVSTIKQQNNAPNPQNSQKNKKKNDSSANQKKVQNSTWQDLQSNWHRINMEQQISNNQIVLGKKNSSLLARNVVKKSQNMAYQHVPLHSQTSTESKNPYDTVGSYADGGKQQRNWCHGALNLSKSDSDLMNNTDSGSQSIEFSVQGTAYNKKVLNIQTSNKLNSKQYYRNRQSQAPKQEGQPVILQVTKSKRNIKLISNVQSSCEAQNQDIKQQSQINPLKTNKDTLNYPKQQKGIDNLQPQKSGFHSQLPAKTIPIQNNPIDGSNLKQGTLKTENHDQCTTTLTDNGQQNTLSALTQKSPGKQAQVEPENMLTQQTFVGISSENREVPADEEAKILEKLNEFIHKSGQTTIEDQIQHDASIEKQIQSKLHEKPRSNQHKNVDKVKDILSKFEKNQLQLMKKKLMQDAQMNTQRAGRNHKYGIIGGTQQLHDVEQLMSIKNYNPQFTKVQYQKTTSTLQSLQQVLSGGKVNGGTVSSFKQFSNLKMEESSDSLSIKQLDIPNNNIQVRVSYDSFKKEQQGKGDADSLELQLNFTNQMVIQDEGFIEDTKGHNLNDSLNMIKQDLKTLGQDSQQINGNQSDQNFQKTGSFFHQKPTKVQHVLQGSNSQATLLKNSIQAHKQMNTQMYKRYMEKQSKNDQRSQQNRQIETNSMNLIGVSPQNKLNTFDKTNYQQRIDPIFLATFQGFANQNSRYLEKERELLDLQKSQPKNSGFKNQEASGKDDGHYGDNLEKINKRELKSKGLKSERKSVYNNMVPFGRQSEDISQSNSFKIQNWNSQDNFDAKMHQTGQSNSGYHDQSQKLQNVYSPQIITRDSHDSKMLHPLVKNSNGKNKEEIVPRLDIRKSSLETVQNVMKGKISNPLGDQQLEKMSQYSRDLTDVLNQQSVIQPIDSSKLPRSEQSSDIYQTNQVNKINKKQSETPVPEYDGQIIQKQLVNLKQNLPDDNQLQNSNKFQNIDDQHADNNERNKADSGNTFNKNTSQKVESGMVDSSKKPDQVYGILAVETLKRSSQITEKTINQKISSHKNTSYNGKNDIVAFNYSDKYTNARNLEKNGRVFRKSKNSGDQKEQINNISPVKIESILIGAGPEITQIKPIALTNQNKNNLQIQSRMKQQKKTIGGLGNDDQNRALNTPRVESNNNLSAPVINNELQMLDRSNAGVSLNIDSSNSCIQKNQSVSQEKTLPENTSRNTNNLASPVKAYETNLEANQTQHLKKSLLQEDLQNIQPHLKSITNIVKNSNSNEDLTNEGQFDSSLQLSTSRHSFIKNNDIETLIQGSGKQNTYFPRKFSKKQKVQQNQVSKDKPMFVKQHSSVDSQESRVQSTFYGLPHYKQDNHTQITNSQEKLESAGMTLSGRFMDLDKEDPEDFKINVEGYEWLEELIAMLPRQRKDVRGDGVPNDNFPAVTQKKNSTQSQNFNLHTSRQSPNKGLSDNTPDAKINESLTQRHRLMKYKAVGKWAAAVRDIEEMLIHHQKVGETERPRVQRSKVPELQDQRYTYIKKDHNNQTQKEQLSSPNLQLVAQKKDINITTYRSNKEDQKHQQNENKPLTQLANLSQPQSDMLMKNSSRESKISSTGFYEDQESLRAKNKDNNGQIYRGEDNHFNRNEFQQAIQNDRIGQVKVMEGESHVKEHEIVIENQLKASQNDLKFDQDSYKIVSQQTSSIVSPTQRQMNFAQKTNKIKTLKISEHISNLSDPYNSSGQVMVNRFHHNIKPNLGSSTANSLIYSSLRRQENSGKQSTQQMQFINEIDIKNRQLAQSQLLKKLSYGETVLENKQLSVDQRLTPLNQGLDTSFQQTQQDKTETTETLVTQQNQYTSPPRESSFPESTKNISHLKTFSPRERSPIPLEAHPVPQTYLPTVSDEETPDSEHPAAPQVNYQTNMVNEDLAKHYLMLQMLLCGDGNRSSLRERCRLLKQMILRLGQGEPDEAEAGQPVDRSKKEQSNVNAVNQSIQMRRNFEAVINTLKKTTFQENSLEHPMNKQSSKKKEQLKHGGVFGGMEQQIDQSEPLEIKLVKSPDPKFKESREADANSVLNKDNKFQISFGKKNFMQNSSSISNLPHNSNHKLKYGNDLTEPSLQPYTQIPSSTNPHSAQLIARQSKRSGFKMQTLTAEDLSIRGSEYGAASSQLPVVRNSINVSFNVKMD